MPETNCIFCKIVDGQIPSRKIYEDENVIAILDLSQVTPGHTLVIPKKHVITIFDYDEETAAEVFKVLPKIARALRDFDSEVKGLNILNNNEEVAFQSVFHSHIHLIPRYSDTDDFGVKWAHNEDKYSEADLDKIQLEIQKQLEE